MHIGVVRGDNMSLLYCVDDIDLGLSFWPIPCPVPWSLTGLKITPVRLRSSRLSWCQRRRPIDLDNSFVEKTKKMSLFDRGHSARQYPWTREVTKASLPQYITFTQHTVLPSLPKHSLCPLLDFYIKFTCSQEKYFLFYVTPFLNCRGHTGLQVTTLF